MSAQNYELFLTFFDESHDIIVKFEKENRQKSTQYSISRLFSIGLLVYRKFSRTRTIHSGIFLERAQWPDSPSTYEHYRVT